MEKIGLQEERTAIISVKFGPFEYQQLHDMISSYRVYFKLK